MKKNVILVCLALSSGLTAAPIHEAAKRCDVKKIASFIEKKTNINAKDNKGWTPLMYLAWTVPLNDPLNDIRIQAEAANKGMDACFEGLQLMIRAGADVNARAHDDTTALYLAMNHHTRYVRALVDAKADPNVGPFDPSDKARGKQKTPLFWVCDRPMSDDAGLEQLQILLKAGANPNEEVAYRGTPLAEAVRRSHLKYIKPLVDGGADVNLKGDAGKGTTPLKIAIEKCNEKLCNTATFADFSASKDMQEIIRILKAAGAREE